MCDNQPTEQQEKNGRQNSETGCNDYQEIIEQITQLRETVIQLESRLLNQSTHHDRLIMRHILAQFKRILRQLESITPYQYDGLVMTMMGGF